MNGAYSPQAHRSRWQSLLGATPHSTGLTGLHEALCAGSAIIDRHCTPILRRKQRAVRGLHELPVEARMDQQRHDYTCPARTRNCGLLDSDTHWLQAESSSMVCSDMVVVRLDAGNGYCKDRLRAGPVLQERFSTTITENASLTPSAGGYWYKLAPPHGVESPSFTPSNGSMWTRFCICSAPSAGDYLDIAIYRREQT